jgi:Concanavalin A-like lectin/glucanases superfamily/Bacterial Ig-like domain (group 3)
MALLGTLLVTSQLIPDRSATASAAAVSHGHAIGAGTTIHLGSPTVIDARHLPPAHFSSAPVLERDGDQADHEDPTSPTALPRRNGVITMQPAQLSRTHAALRANAASSAPPTSAYSFSAGSYLQELSYNAAAWPPDTQVAVGPGANGQEDVVEILNSTLFFYDGSGVPRAPYHLDLRSFFGANATYPVETDARMIYDPGSGHFFASAELFNPSTNNAEVNLAVSSTADPTGAWWLYTVAGNTAGVKYDQPKLGISSDKLVVSWTQYNSAQNPIGTSWDVLQKSDAVTGGSVGVDAFTSGNSGQWLGLAAVQALQPTSTAYATYANGNQLGVIFITGTPDAGNVSAYENDVPLASVWSPPTGVRQPGSGTTSPYLDVQGLPVQSAIWKNNMLWVAGTDSCLGDTGIVGCSHVVQVSTANGTATNVQDVNLSAAGTNLVDPAAMLDGNNNLYVTFTVSSPTQFPSAGVAVAPGGQLTSNLTFSTYAQGTSPYDDGTGLSNSRWGDYSGAAPDPINPQDVWLGAEYTVNADGSANPSPYWVTQIGRFSFTTPCTPASSTSGAYAKAVLASAPLGYWRLDATSAGCLADSSGHSLDGTPSAGGLTFNQPGAPLGDNNTALAFDGASGAVTVGDPAALQPAQVTVEAWINSTSAPNSINTIVRKRLYGYDLYLNANGTPAFYIYDQNATQYVASGPTSVADGNWHYLVGVYDGQQVCLYVDGQQVSCQPAGAIFYNAGAVVIGRDGDSPGGYFNGRIDDVAIYGAALTSAQVQAHLAATKLSSTTTIASSPNPSVSGQAVTFTATVPSGSAGTPTGTVTFKDGATTLGTSTLNAGHATYSTSSLSVASHAISAAYGGDNNYAGSSSAALSQMVKKASTSATLSGVLNPSVHGQSVTFTATESATAPGAGTPTGTVFFRDGATTIGSAPLNGGGVATLTLANLAVGAHSITAYYGGDANFTANTSAAFIQTENKAATSTGLTSSANPSLFGANVTLSATVSAVAPGAGTRTGTVTFMDGAATLGTGTVNASGVATFSTTTLGQGSHAITAVYSGDANYTGSTSPVVTQNVRKNTTTVVTSSGSPSVFGQNVTFTATISPSVGLAPSGTVTFKDGAAILGTGAVNGSGAATLSTSSLSGANHTISAVYGGDANFNGSTSPGIFQTINKAATSASLTSSANPSVFGQNVTFTATESASAPGAGAPTGTVLFRDGMTTIGSGTLNAGGVATFSSTSLALGSHSITAYYGGDANFTANTSTALSQVVNKAATTTTLTSSANSSVSGQNVTFTATVNASAPGAGTRTGTVTFMDGATTLGTGAVNAGGVATFSSASLAVASHSITAVYGGDAHFTGSTSVALTQTVNKALAAVALTSSLNPSTHGTAVTFTATVSAIAPGAGIPSGTVAFKDGATTLIAVALNASGVATFTTSSLAVGTHSITASYSGDGNFHGAGSAALAQTVN